MADPDPTKSFIFADHMVLDDSPTRTFYTELLQGLIHKNNNMLGVVQGFSSLILMDDDVPAGIAENIKQMKDSATQATELAKGILTTAGCAKVQIEETSIDESLPYYEQTVRALADEAGVAFQFNKAGDLPNAMVDSNRLSEILRELAKNAVEAAALLNPKGEVAIDFFPPGESFEGNYINVFIRNSSEDIPSEKVLGYFLPFEGTKSNDHNGLGLTTAAILAGQMGMRLGFRNAEGTTTIWLTIPVA